jgi:hypothetical protein
MLMFSVADGGQFKLIAMHPTTFAPSATENININVTASDFKNAIKDYYSSNFGSDIDVTRDTYDSSGNLTTNLTNATKSIYTITLKKLISGQSVSNVMATKTGTSA